MGTIQAVEEVRSFLTFRLVFSKNCHCCHDVRPLLIVKHCFVVADQIGLTEEVYNPALPPLKKTTLPSRFRPPAKLPVTTTRGIGSKRVYLDIQAHPPNVAYPPRPVPGSVIDLDVIMDNCDFSQNKVFFSELESASVADELDSMFAIVWRFYVWAPVWIMGSA